MPGVSHKVVQSAVVAEVEDVAGKGSGTMYMYPPLAAKAQTAIGVFRVRIVAKTPPYGRPQ